MHAGHDTFETTVMCLCLLGIRLTASIVINALAIADARAEEAKRKQSSTVSALKGRNKLNLKIIIPLMALMLPVFVLADSCATLIFHSSIDDSHILEIRAKDDVILVFHDAKGSHRHELGAGQQYKVPFSGKLPTMDVFLQTNKAICPTTTILGAPEIGCLMKTFDRGFLCTHVHWYDYFIDYQYILVFVIILGFLSLILSRCMPTTCVFTGGNKKKDSEDTEKPKVESAETNTSRAIDRLIDYLSVSELAKVLREDERAKAADAEKLKMARLRMERNIQRKKDKKSIEMTVEAMSQDSPPPSPKPTKKLSKSGFSINNTMFFFTIFGLLSVCSSEKLYPENRIQTFSPNCTPADSWQKTFGIEPLRYSEAKIQADEEEAAHFTFRVLYTGYGHPTPEEVEAPVDIYEEPLIVEPQSGTQICFDDVWELGRACYAAYGEEFEQVACIKKRADKMDAVAVLLFIFATAAMISELFREKCSLTFLMFYWFIFILCAGVIHAAPVMPNTQMRVPETPIAQLVNQQVFSNHQRAPVVRGPNITSVVTTMYMPTTTQTRLTTTLPTTLDTPNVPTSTTEILSSTGQTHFPIPGVRKPKTTTTDLPTSTNPIPNTTLSSTTINTIAFTSTNTEITTSTDTEPIRPHPIIGHPKLNRNTVSSDEIFPPFGADSGKTIVHVIVTKNSFREYAFPLRVYSVNDTLHMALQTVFHGCTMHRKGSDFRVHTAFGKYYCTSADDRLPSVRLYKYHFILRDGESIIFDNRCVFKNKANFLDNNCGIPRGTKDLLDPAKTKLAISHWREGNMLSEFDLFLLNPIFVSSKVVETTHHAIINQKIRMVNSLEFLSGNNSLTCDCREKHCRIRNPDYCVDYSPIACIGRKTTENLTQYEYYPSANFRGRKLTHNMTGFQIIEYALDEVNSIALGIQPYAYDKKNFNDQNYPVSIHVSANKSVRAGFLYDFYRMELDGMEVVIGKNSTTEPEIYYCANHTRVPIDYINLLYYDNYTSDPHSYTAYTELEKVPCVHLKGRTEYCNAKNESFRPPIKQDYVATEHTLVGFGLLSQPYHRKAYAYATSTGGNMMHGYIEPSLDVFYCLLDLANNPSPDGEEVIVETPLGTITLHITFDELNLFTMGCRHTRLYLSKELHGNEFYAPPCGMFMTYDVSAGIKHKSTGKGCVGFQQHGEPELYVNLDATSSFSEALLVRATTGRKIDHDCNSKIDLLDKCITFLGENIYTVKEAIHANSIDRHCLHDDDREFQVDNKWYIQHLVLGISNATRNICNLTDNGIYSIVIPTSLETLHITDLNYVWENKYYYPSGTMGIYAAQAYSNQALSDVATLLAQDPASTVAIVVTLCLSFFLIIVLLSSMIPNRRMNKYAIVQLIMCLLLCASPADSTFSMYGASMGCPTTSSITRNFINRTSRLDKITNVPWYLPKGELGYNIGKDPQVVIPPKSLGRLLSQGHCSYKIGDKTACGIDLAVEGYTPFTHNDFVTALGTLDIVSMDSDENAKCDLKYKRGKIHLSKGSTFGVTYKCGNTSESMKMLVTDIDAFSYCDYKWSTSGFTPHAVCTWICDTMYCTTQPDATLGMGLFANVPHSYSYTNDLLSGHSDNCDPDDDLTLAMAWVNPSLNAVDHIFRCRTREYTYTVCVLRNDTVTCKQLNSFDAVSDGLVFSVVEKATTIDVIDAIVQTERKVANIGYPSSEVNKIKGLYIGDLSPHFAWGWYGDLRFTGFTPHTHNGEVSYYPVAIEAPALPEPTVSYCDCVASVVPHYRFPDSQCSCNVGFYARSGFDHFYKQSLQEVGAVIGGLKFNGYNFSHASAPLPGRVLKECNPRLVNGETIKCQQHQPVLTLYTEVAGPGAIADVEYSATVHDKNKAVEFNNRLTAAGSICTLVGCKLVLGRLDGTRCAIVCVNFPGDFKATVDTHCTYPFTCANSFTLSATHPEHNISVGIQSDKIENPKLVVEMKIGTTVVYTMETSDWSLAAAEQRTIGLIPKLARDSATTTVAEQSAGLSSLEIALIVIGVVLFLLICAIAAFLVFKHHKDKVKKALQKKKDGEAEGKTETDMRVDTLKETFGEKGLEKLVEEHGLDEVLKMPEAQIGELAPAASWLSNHKTIIIAVIVGVLIMGTIIALIVYAISGISSMLSPFGAAKDLVTSGVDAATNLVTRASTSQPYSRVFHAQRGTTTVGIADPNIRDVNMCHDYCMNDPKCMQFEFSGICYLSTFKSNIEKGSNIVGQAQDLLEEYDDPMPWIIGVGTTCAVVFVTAIIFGLVGICCPQRMKCCSCSCTFNRSLFYGVVTCGLYTCCTKCAKKDYKGMNKKVNAYMAAKGRLLKDKAKEKGKEVKDAIKARANRARHSVGARVDDLGAHLNKLSDSFQRKIMIKQQRKHAGGVKGGNTNSLHNIIAVSLCLITCCTDGAAATQGHVDFGNSKIGGMVFMFMALMVWGRGRGRGQNTYNNNRYQDRQYNNNQQYRNNRQYDNRGGYDNRRGGYNDRGYDNNYYPPNDDYHYNAPPPSGAPSQNGRGGSHSQPTSMALPSMPVPQPLLPTPAVVAAPADNQLANLAAAAMASANEKEAQLKVAQAQLQQEQAKNVNALIDNQNKGARPKSGNWHDNGPYNYRDNGRDQSGDRRGGGGRGRGRGRGGGQRGRAQTPGRQSRSNTPARPARSQSEGRPKVDMPIIDGIKYRPLMDNEQISDEMLPYTLDISKVIHVVVNKDRAAYAKKHPDQFKDIKDTKPLKSALKRTASKVSIAATDDDDDDKPGGKGDKSLDDRSRGRKREKTPSRKGSRSRSARSSSAHITPKSHSFRKKVNTELLQDMEKPNKHVAMSVDKIIENHTRQQLASCVHTHIPMYYDETVDGKKVRRKITAITLLVPEDIEEREEKKPKPIYVSKLPREFTSNEFDIYKEKQKKRNSDEEREEIKWVPLNGFVPFKRTAAVAPVEEYLQESFFIEHSLFDDADVYVDTSADKSLVRKHNELASQLANAAETDVPTEKLDEIQDKMEGVSKKLGKSMPTDFWPFIQFGLVVKWFLTTFKKYYKLREKDQRVKITPQIALLHYISSLVWDNIYGRASTYGKNLTIMKPLLREEYKLDIDSKQVGGMRKKVGFPFAPWMQFTEKDTTAAHASSDEDCFYSDDETPEDIYLDESYPQALASFAGRPVVTPSSTSKGTSPKTSTAKSTSSTASSKPKTKERKSVINHFSTTVERNDGEPEKKEEEDEKLYNDLLNPKSTSSLDSMSSSKPHLTPFTFQQSSIPPSSRPKETMTDEEAIRVLEQEERRKHLLDEEEKKRMEKEKEDRELEEALADLSSAAEDDEEEETRDKHLFD